MGETAEQKFQRIAKLASEFNDLIERHGIAVSEQAWTMATRVQFEKQQREQQAMFEKEMAAMTPNMGIPMPVQPSN
jgi:hypothetical protein